MRAGVGLQQQIGTLRLRGNVAGTTARLQPAELSLTWLNVSLADALRLARESDFGVRGELAVDVKARIAPTISNASDSAGAGGAQWSISGEARLTGLHGWRLPGRGTDPAVNLSFDAAMASRRSPHASPEVPRRNAEFAPAGRWRIGLGAWFASRVASQFLQCRSRGCHVVVSSASPGVPGNLDLEGTLGVTQPLVDGLCNSNRARLASAGGKLTGASLPSPLKIGPINVSGLAERWICPDGDLIYAPTAGGKSGTVSADDAP